jgi:uncharacterized protein
LCRMAPIHLPNNLTKQNLIMSERQFSAHAGVRHSASRAHGAETRAGYRRRAAHPDPASPWVIDTREVGRRPGSMRRYRRTVPAPAGLGYGEVISVPEGADIELDLRIESVVEGVLISGSASASAHGECSRCLDELDGETAATFTELFAYPDSATDSTTEADEVSRIVGDLIDVRPVVHDALLLAMPQAPLCKPDCSGLCPRCGGKRAELGPGHEHETIDPRWAGLIERFGSVNDTSDTPEEN